VNIVWSSRAQKRLREYATQLAQYDYPQTAADWLNKVKSSVETLVDFPESGRESPEFKDRTPMIRDISIGMYRVFYRIVGASVEIISIHNCRQAITSLRSL